MKNHLRTLAQLLPRGTLRFDPATLQANSSDAWVASALPNAVAFPRNTAQVSKILAFTYRHRIPGTTRGAGRGYVGGCVPVRAGLVLSLVKMNRILQISTSQGDREARVLLSMPSGMRRIWSEGTDGRRRGRGLPLDLIGV